MVAILFMSECIKKLPRNGCPFRPILCYAHNASDIKSDLGIWNLELLTAKTPLLHMLYYMNWLTHDFWTRTGGWEFDRFHGAGTSSPSHWQHVKEQAPKPVGGIMYFLLMTFVPVQKLCVNICLCIFYMSFVIGRIYTCNRSVIQHWSSFTPSHSIGLYFWGVRSSWVECHFLFSLVYQLCLALWW